MPNPCRCRPKRGQDRSNSWESRSNLPRFGKTWINIDLFGLESTRTRGELAQCWSEFDESRSTLARARSNIVRSRPTSARICPHLARARTTFSRCLARVRGTSCNQKRRNYKDLGKLFEERSAQMRDCFESSALPRCARVFVVYMYRTAIPPQHVSQLCASKHTCLDQNILELANATLHMSEVASADVFISASIDTSANTSKSSKVCIPMCPRMPTFVLCVSVHVVVLRHVYVGQSSSRYTYRKLVFVNVAVLSLPQQPRTRRRARLTSSRRRRLPQPTAERRMRHRLRLRMRLARGTRGLVLAHVAAFARLRSKGRSAETSARSCVTRELGEVHSKHR